MLEALFQSWRATLLLLFLAALALPVSAQAPDVIVGRADADASGGWPVLLWVRDGPRSHVIVRAPHRELGAGPGLTWQPADAEALMQLERFGAPLLQKRLDHDPCRTDLDWGRIVSLPLESHWPGELEALAHPACGAAVCPGSAWRLDLPSSEPTGGAGPTLPLQRLLPRLAQAEPQWLVVLAVVGSADALAVDGLPQLQVPADLRWDRPIERWANDVFPEAAAAQFPSLQARMLDHLAQAQGLGSASVLMRSDPVSHVQPRRYLRSWAPPLPQRQALGLDAAGVQEHQIHRLLLRLVPGQVPAELRLRAVPWEERLFGTSYALWAAPGDEASCRGRVAAWRCEASCGERVAALADVSRSAFVADTSVLALAPEAQPAACLRSCEAQQDALAAGVARRYAAAARRQQDAWRWVERLTGSSGPGDAPR